MKKLYIIRHAKSSWKDLTLHDFDRPLNKRDKRDAPFMAKILKNKNVMPDVILSSPALRAKNLAKVFAKELRFSKSIVYKKNIYNTDINTLQNILKKLDNKDSTVFLFGHNTELNILASMYVDFNQNLPTSGVIEIAFDCDKWTDIGTKNANFLSFECPKMYKQ
jgi:phosphohistidine phosphatase